MPKHFPEETRDAHLLEVSSDLLGGHAASGLGLPVTPEGLSCTRESLLQFLCSETIGSTMSLDTRMSCNLSQTND